MLARAGLGLVGFALFLAGWEALRWMGIVSERVGAFPSTLASFLAARPALDGLGQAMLVSAQQFALSFSVAGCGGVVLGLVFGWYRRLGKVLEPLLVATNSVPLIAIIPMLIVTLGVGGATTFTVVALFVFFPVYFSVSSAVAGVDAQLVRMCRSFGGRDRHVLGGIVLPTTVPAVISGLRLAVGRGLTGLVVVELFMGRGGLGSVILDSVNQGLPNLALLAVVVLGGANLAATGILQALQGRVESWRPRPATR